MKTSKKKFTGKFDIVQMYYPNESLKNISETLNVQTESFNWFLCSHRIFDDDNKMYYANISTDVQFYCVNSGKSMIARGLSKKGEKYYKPEVIRAKLLILSDSHNKKMLCKHFGYLCGCDSDRDVLSTECYLTTNKNLLIKGAEKALDLGYGGVVIRHDCLDSDTNNSFICRNATFVFKKGILENIEGLYPERCGIIKYSKKHNSCIRNIVRTFPTCEEIDNLLKTKDCSKVSIILYDMIREYMEKRRK